MADFALGLTKTAVEGTLSRVQSAIDEENKLKAAAQQDLVYITGEFQMMQAFLKVANKERTSNQVVKTWVRQLHDLAFDVEDCVEFVIHLDNNSAWTWVWRLLPSCMAPAQTRDLDKAVADLRKLKARVEEVSQRNTRYNLISDSGSTPTAPADQLANSTGSRPSTVHTLKELWAANMKLSSLRDLTDLIDTDGSDLKVISIWRKEFLKSLLNQLYESAHQEKLGADLRKKEARLIRDELKQLLTIHKYLIIIEDLSSAVEWDFIKSNLPDPNNDSRIIISTQQLGLALSCTGEPCLALELREFSDGQYLFAFFKQVNFDIAKLFRQLGDRRVISLWGDKGGYADSLIAELSHRLSLQKVSGVKFEEVEWVGYYEDPESLDPIKPRSREDAAYLVVIKGLLSKEDWDKIKDRVVPEGTKGCAIIIANEKDVADYCGKDVGLREIDEEQSKANEAIRPFTKCGRHYCGDSLGYLYAQGVFSLGYRPEDCHSFLSNRIEEACCRVPFIMESQYEVMATIDYCHVQEGGVHAVWGTVGVGKSALVRYSCYVNMVFSLGITKKANIGRFGDFDGRRHPFNMFGWVDVPDPFDLAEFSRRLLLDFHSLDPHEMEATAVGIIQGHDPIQGCYDIMHGNICLVVIDGLRSKQDWDSIKQALLRGNLYELSSILVITTEKSVAQHCVDIGDREGRTLNVRALEDVPAFDLFQKVAGELYSNLEIAKQMVTKCGGLPRIIAAVGQAYFSFMKDINGDRVEASTSFLKDINDDLVVKLQTDQQFHDLRVHLSWMHSYFDACDDSVKPYIFYLSVFPINRQIRRGRLLRRWITEGYSRDIIGRTAKKNAELIFSKLIELGIIHQIESNGMWQINGFFREYIISQPMEDNLVFALEGNCKVNSQRTGQHLTIMEKWDGDKILFDSLDFSRLRSLTVFGKWEYFFVSDSMKRIRVLDLENTLEVKNDGLEQVLRKLVSLKFISLRGCTDITYLPDSVGELRQLQTLNVRQTSIVALPSAILKLLKIQYIRAGTIVSSDEHQRRPQLARADTTGVEVPVGIWNMSSLRTLGVVNANAKGGKAILKKLKNLTQLIKLSVSGMNHEKWENLWDSLSGHGHLESLFVRFDEDFFESFKPPKTLRSLKLHGAYTRTASLYQGGAWQSQDFGFIKMIIPSLRDMHFLEKLPHQAILVRLFINPTQENEYLNKHVMWGCRRKPPRSDKDPWSESTELFYCK
ncbi:uncharacterized protein LOC100829849 [Brachypodium distachyon]|uniref:uncharacterized protein LOC100829849 n=1 Tax=Brachypodium distachyon TaxID=15368 RepID=UPI000D0D7CFA|nr:uncharacterized protein LOC100829849 [Brachypodium distachyon]|eukprot:XP_024313064.1 uncharacterized protein LOC100829849 [Brachypodium distachyon]